MLSQSFQLTEYYILVNIGKNLQKNKIKDTYKHTSKQKLRGIHWGIKNKCGKIALASTIIG